MHTVQLNIDDNIFDTVMDFLKLLPKNKLKIGMIKYPKLASIILSVATAYIQTLQLVKIKKLVINNIKRLFLFFIILKKKFHFE